MQQLSHFKRLPAVACKLLLAILFVTLQACTSIYQPPQPWERDKLSHEKMAIGGDPMDSSIDDHIYFSKEGSSIGSSIGGGGCGCN